jgi:hypothetical protein
MDKIVLDWREKTLVATPAIIAAMIAGVKWYDQIFIDRNVLIGEMWALLLAGVGISAIGLFVVSWNNGVLAFSVIEAWAAYGGTALLLNWLFDSLFILIGAVPVCLIEGRNPKE